MAEAEQTFTTEVDASVEDCCAVLLDFEQYPQWSGPTTAVEVLDRHPDGRARRVAMTLDMKIRNVRYVLEYDYDLPRGAHWHLVEGDLTDVVGKLHLRRDLMRSTRARRARRRSTWDSGCRDPLRRLIERQALRDSVLEFKGEAERRARAHA